MIGNSIFYLSTPPQHFYRGDQSSVYPCYQLSEYLYISIQLEAFNFITFFLFCFRQPSEHELIKAGGRGRKTMCGFAEEDLYMFDDERFLPPKLMEPELKQQTASFYLSIRSSGQSNELLDTATNDQCPQGNLTDLKPIAISTQYDDIYEPTYDDNNSYCQLDKKQQVENNNTAPFYTPCRESSGHAETLARESNYDYAQSMSISYQNQHESDYENMNTNRVHLHPGASERLYDNTDASRVTYSIDSNLYYNDDINNKKNNKCILM